ncbi:bifunctional 4-hydroxy-2-oxoglutarate aldolase/2-dehydro-3-deoxy-phosphogluconate aldolase [Olsenella sp. Marseille-P4559]|uniref:bifunctional 4-hydroxy-2-oxoglutarate aldolase/2-dehydro-3-deoxy-phosphogluconate aldolase n=1 Tax=Olsenella sp. Marseille-P4559 TaxID=2364795 RepID=UPI0010316D37|nr:bifunctional 4-hydroxy-2-oxoglutarate aldolase/2-dehydro-3-deoxy-phosphogluconate aldolase [Olsenella sp. Marseille-P4559]
MIDPSITKFPKVTVILRGYTYEQVRCVVKNMVGTRLRAVEVAMNTTDAAKIIEGVSREFGDEVLVGAGTVISSVRANAAVEAGARFALSPICFTQEIFSICKANGLMTVPSAFSPSEVWNMFEMGADIVKVFPAGTLGPKYVRDIQAPLNPMPIMVVGGVNGDNCQEFFDNGASYAGIGSGIFDPKHIIEADDAGLKADIEAFEQKVRW